MKRIFIAAALAAFLLPASAQMQIKQFSNGQDAVMTRRVYETCRMGVMKLVSLNGMYAIEVPTTNQFDKVLALHIGDTDSTAYSTMNTLLSLCDTLNCQSTMLVQFGQLDCALSRERNTKCLNVKADGYAGLAYLNAPEIKKLRKYFDNKPNLKGKAK